ncbi:MAG: 50S ribosomal protein L18Ae [Candidatus Diapherotrites archaeon]|nr:50S ribosomal protein L18Ae [Candidatus Diapherotrites archaeon]
MAGEKNFLVEGEIEARGVKKKFSKKIKAQTPAFAAEKAMCLFGSKNRVKRNKILIREIKEEK